MSKPCPLCGSTPSDGEAIRSFAGVVESTMTDLSEQMKSLVDGVVDSIGYGR